MSNKTYIGIDIGGTTIVSGLMVNGLIKKTYTVETFANKPKNEILNQLYKAIDEVLTNDVEAIGIGCPGFINSGEGRIVNINNIPALQNVNLVDEVKNKYSKPTFLDNDANCFVLGETYFGAGKGYNHILGITLGTGLGGGVVIDKKAYGGLFGAAGEIGCIPYKDGIVEDYTSSKFFANNYNSTGFELFKKAEKGDAIAVSAFRELGNNIGWLINNVLYTLAPEAIIIGGSIVGAFKYIEPGIKDELGKFMFDVIKKNIVIKPAVLDNAGIVGAASLCVANLE